MSHWVGRAALVFFMSVAFVRATSAATVELTVTPEPGSASVVLDVTGDDGVSPHIVEFQIVRKEFTGVIEEGCGPTVTIATLARPVGTGSYSFRVQDATLAADRAYRYGVMGMPGYTLGEFDDHKSWALISTGQALIAAGARVHETAGVLGIVSCSCLAWTGSVASAPAEIVNSDLLWRLYGRIQPREGPVRWYEFIVEAGQPVDHCDDFAVLPSTWATVKSLYR